MDEEQSLLGVRNDNKLCAGVKPDQDFLFDRAIGIRRRDHFDDQVGSTRKVLFLTEAGSLMASLGDERHIGPPHFVRIGVKQETGLGCDDDAEAVGLNMPREVEADSIRDSAMPEAG